MEIMPNLKVEADNGARLVIGDVVCAERPTLYMVELQEAEKPIFAIIDTL